MRKLPRVALLLAGFSLLGTVMYAALIGVQGQTRFPRTRYTGTVSFASGPRNLTVTGVPTTEELVAGLVRNVDTPKSLSIGMHFLDPAGTTYEGIGPNALYMEGTVDLNGNGIIEAGESGVMLTGDLLEYGTASNPNTHQSSVDFRFKVTGGYLAPFYAGQNAGAYAVFDTPANPGADWTTAILNARVQPLKCGVAIGDFVWNDTNANGIQDAGEPGIDGVTVNLLNPDGSVKATTVTGIGPLNQHGYYEFSEAAFARKGQDTAVLIGFCAGTWRVQVDTTTLPAGFAATVTNAPGSTTANDSNPNPSTVVLTTDISKDFTHDFGFRSGAVGHIGDFVWHDQNRDGIQTAGEPGIDGVTVTLRNGATDALLATTTTGPNGFYHFTGLFPGTYKVVVDETTLPAGGYTRTVTGQGTTATDSSDTPVFVTLSAGNMDDHTIDFGYVTPCTGAIGNFVWYDQNQNGIQDAGEPGLAGVTVNLRDSATDAILATTTTGANGDYQFTGICGTFKVEVDVTTLPAGMSPTQVGAPGSTLDNDSNTNPDTVSVADGATDNSIDFGFIAPCTGRIGDFVWHDANGNGIQDAGELGLAGVTVNLKRASDNAVIQTDITDGNGGYMFEGLCPASYIVEVVPPEGYTASPTEQGADRGADSNTNGSTVTLPLDNSEDLTVDFGFVGSPAITILKLTNGTDNDSAPGLYVATGSAVTWSYIVTNTGNVTLTNVTVTDNQGVTVTCPKTTLAAGESMTCTGSGVAIAGQYTNVGTATGHYGGSTVTANNPDNYFGANPAISLLKKTNGTNNDSAPGIQVLVGSTVTWTYIVTNTGNVPLTDVAVSDDKIGAITCPATSLAVGASMTCSATGTAILGQYTNMGSVTGKGNGTTVSATNPDNYYGVGGTIVIIKNAKPASGTFAFTTTTTGSAYAGFSLTGSTSGGGNTITRTNLLPGTYTVKETSQTGWVLSGIGGSTNPETPYDCVVTGTHGSTGSGNLGTQTATISLKAGDTVTCTFENTGVSQGATRTIGYWQTHWTLANVAWFGGSYQGKNFTGIKNLLGDTTVCRPVDTLGRLMGGFWASIPKKTTGDSRTSLEQARMQLLQQLLGAELNYAAFGTLPAGGANTLKSWEAALCGTDVNAIKSAQGAADTFNNSGDSVTFSPGSSADPKGAKAVADLPYWNITK